MKKRTVIITLIVATAALIALPLLARPNMRAHGFGGERGGFGMHLFGHLDRVREELDLSDGQVDQIRDIFRATREQNKPYREQMKGGMHEVATILLADPTNTTAAQAIIARQDAAERAIKQNMLAATSKALNVLTPQQRTKLAQMIAERRARRAQR